MKKLIVTIAILASVAASSSYGQGTVFFNNTGGTRVSTNSGPSSVTGSGLVAAAQGGFYYALFYSTTTNSVGGSTSSVIGTNGLYAFSATGWSDGSAGASGPYATNGAAGRFAASTQNSDGSYSVTGLAGGGSADFVIIGWSANIGSTLAALQAWLANPTVTGYIGESAVSGSFAAGTLGSTPAATIMGAASPNIPGFILGEVVAVPEPGTDRKSVV